MPIQTETPDVWTPPVWQQGPDGLQAQSKSDLWNVHNDLQTVLRTGPGGAGGGDAMAGSGTSPINETDQLISTKPGQVTSVAGEWQKGLKELRNGTEPLDAWEGSGTPPMNPAP